jgi:branched-chain amino acid transport system permease protein
MVSLAISGLAAGGAYALIGVCLLLSYRIGSVVNISQTFVGTFAVFVMAWLIGEGLSTWPAIAAAVVIGGLITAGQGLVMARWFSEAGVLTRTTLTIAMAVTMYAIADRLFGTTVRVFPTLFTGLHATIGGTYVSGLSIVSVGGAVALSFLVWVGLTRTRIGITMRAVAARPVAAELLGVRSRAMVVSVWAVGGVLTTAALILIAPTRGSVTNLSELVVPGLAAALVGGMQRVSLTVVGGLALGAVEAMSLDSPSLSPYGDALPFLIVAAVLLFARRGEVWGELR